MQNYGDNIYSYIRRPTRNRTCTQSYTDTQTWIQTLRYTHKNTLVKTTTNTKAPPPHTHTTLPPHLQTHTNPISLKNTHHKHTAATNTHHHLYKHTLSPPSQTDIISTGETKYHHHNHTHIGKHTSKNLRYNHHKIQVAPLQTHTLALPL